MWNDIVHFRHFPVWPLLIIFIYRVRLYINDKLEFKSESNHTSEINVDDEDNIKIFKKINFYIYKMSIKFK